MNPLIEKNFILSDFGEEITENAVFIFCNFRSVSLNANINTNGSWTSSGSKGATRLTIFYEANV
jgi:hypothetical protein